MNIMREAIRRHADFMQARERVVLKRWLRVHVADVHLNDGKILWGINNWNIDELVKTVECHGGDAKLLRERAKSEAIGILERGNY